MPLEIPITEQLTTTLALIRGRLEQGTLRTEELALSVGVSPAYLQSCLIGKRRLAPSRLAILCREVGLGFHAIAGTLDSLVGGTAYLRQVRAAQLYKCAFCSAEILRYEPYVRLEPFGPTRQAGAQILHFCKACSILGGWLEPATETRGGSSTPLDRQIELPFSPFVKPTRVQLIDISATLWTKILNNPEELFHLSSPQFEEFVFERLCAMGLRAERMGGTFRKDGGIDIVFTPPKTFPFPFIGAVQAKHHRNPCRKVGPAPIRELQGVLAANRIFNAGMIVTNTTFTPDARDFAKHSASGLRLRDFLDLKRWIADNFTDDAEWREIPDQIELCRGVTINLRS